MVKMRQNLSYLTSQAAERTKALEALLKKLQQEGFGAERARLITKPRKKDVATEIVEHARDEKCNIIVLNHKSGKTTRFFTTGVHSKVIAGAGGATVCIVT